MPHAAAQQPDAPRAPAGGAATSPGGDAEDAAALRQAATRYRAAIALDPTVAAYHASLAVVLLRQGELAEARAAAAEAVRLDPASSRNRAVLGEVLAELGRWADAEAQLEQAVRRGHREPVTLGLLGRAYEEQGKWADAAAAYDDALRIEPASERFLERLEAARARAGATPIPELAAPESPTEPGGSAILMGLRVVSAVLLVVAAAGLLYPILAFLYLTLVLPPLRLLRGAA